MAGFTTHITTSTILGVGYGTAAHLGLGIPLAPCVLAGGLCSVSGMLPDMDSQSGRPVREGACFMAAIVPMLMLDRFSHLGWSAETMALVGAVLYVVIRFGLPYLLAKFSDHRGMWHSLPAAAIAGLFAFLICSGEHIGIRGFKAGGVMLGFISHLVLDEIYSFDVSIRGVRVKRSFGTALKFYSKSMWANFSTYGKLAALIVLAIGDPLMMEEYDYHPRGATEMTAREIQYKVESMWR